jgi:tetratricopeptide (TPR) repeat protein
VLRDDVRRQELSHFLRAKRAAVSPADVDPVVVERRNTQQLQREEVASVAGASDISLAVQPGVFRKEGEYWTVGYGGKTLRLRHTRGLGYLAHLLRHPGVEFHVLDLSGGIASQREETETRHSLRGLPRGDEDLEKAGMRITRLGDAGEMLDEQAKVAYRHRLSELREELETANEVGNVDRAEQTEQEIDALTAELSRAVGLGGRKRRAASASERARQSITKSIKSVLERIAQSDAALGDTFSRCIRTGIFCSYQPDPHFPIAWEFAATDAEPAIEPVTQAGANGEFAPMRSERPSHHAHVARVVLEASPFSLAEQTAFVGRESEGSAVRAAILRALTGHGSLVMLEGGPGVGKSRLAMEMAEYASRIGFRCQVGHCYERDEPFPYLPFVEIIESGLAQATSLDDYRRLMGDNAAALAQLVPSLHRIFPDIPEPVELPPAQKRRYFFQSLSEALGRVSRERPQLRILEDLHWADESTLALLVHLADRVAQLPLVIIATYRSGYLEDNPAWVRTLEELIRRGIRPLKLNGLSKDVVAQMLHGLSQRQAPESLVNLIFEETQGNPFFVEEVYRHLVEEGKVFDPAGQFRTDLKVEEIDVPENVRLIIGRRLARLEENERRALAAAALIGRSFSFQLLSGISQIDVDELFTVIEKAQQMGIIVPSSEGPERPFTFSHELVRQTLLAGISDPRQEQLHARVADAIERLYPGAVNERAAEVADHLLKAGSFADSRSLVRWLRLAGKGALEASAFEEARHSFRTALAHLDAVEVRERADLLTSLAMAERGLDHWDVIVANLREALDIYLNLPDREMIGRSFTKLTDALFWCGQFQEAIETANRGLAYLQADVSADRARLLAALGQVLALAADYELAQAALQDALDIACQLSDPILGASVLCTRAIVNSQFFGLREAAADGLRSEQLSGPEAPPWQRAIQLAALHQTVLYLGRPEDSMHIAEELEPLAGRIGQAYSVALCVSTRAWIEFGKAPDLIKLEAALRQVSKPDQRTLPFALYEVLQELDLGLIDFFRGEWASALTHAQALRRPEVGIPVEGLGVGMLFRQLAYAGERASAFAILDESRGRLPLKGRPNTRGSWLMLALVIEGLVILGERSQAGQLYPLVVELVGTGAVALWPISRFTQTIAGTAAAAAGQWDAAEEHFQIALRQAGSFPSRLEQAEIRRFRAMMLMDRAVAGDHERAQTLLREAQESYTDIGMPRHIAMTQTLLGQVARG